MIEICRRCRKKYNKRKGQLILVCKRCNGSPTKRSKLPTFITYEDCDPAKFDRNFVNWKTVKIKY